MPKSQLAS